MQSVLSAWGRGAVGSFGEDLGVDAIAVVQRNLILEGGRNEDVAGNIPNGVRIRECFGAGEILDGACFLAKLVQFFDRNAIRVVYRGVIFRDADDLAPIFLRQKF